MEEESLLKWWWGELSDDERKIKSDTYKLILAINRPINNSDILKIWQSEQRNGLSHPPIVDEKIEYKLKPCLASTTKKISDATNWFHSKTYLEQHGLSDIYFESKNPTLLSISEICEIYENEVKKNNDKQPQVMTKIEAIILENQQVIMEALDKLINLSGNRNQPDLIQKLNNRNIVTDTVLCMYKEYGKN